MIEHHLEPDTEQKILLSLERIDLESGGYGTITLVVRRGKIYVKCETDISIDNDIRDNDV